MKREDIAHLASLARIRLTEEEMNVLPEELSSIVSYVSTVQTIVGDNVSATPEVGPHHNVFRKDEVTNKPDQYTSDIMAEMPATEGRYLAVKKILDIGE